MFIFISCDTMLGKSFQNKIIMGLDEFEKYLLERGHQQVLSSAA